MKKIIARRITSKHGEKLERKDLCRIWDCSRYTINRMINLGIIPAPIEVNCRKHYWKRRDINHWIIERKENEKRKSKLTVY